MPSAEVTSPLYSIASPPSRPSPSQEEASWALLRTLLYFTSTPAMITARLSNSPRTADRPPSPPLALPVTIFRFTSQLLPCRASCDLVGGAGCRGEARRGWALLSSSYGPY